jgi:hypothetical protein
VKLRIMKWTKWDAGVEDLVEKEIIVGHEACRHFWGHFSRRRVQRRDFCTQTISTFVQHLLVQNSFRARRVLYDCGPDMFSRL